MNQPIDLPIGNLYLISAQHILGLTLDLALLTGVRLLICGNRLPFYEIAYALASHIGQEYERILKEKIFFSRAETCIQLVNFLSETKAEPTPLLVTDILARFNEEDDNRVDALFFACQVELERLSKVSLVFVSGTPRPPLERLGYVLKRNTRQFDYG